MDQELSRVGATKQLLYEAYKRQHTGDYGSSQFYLLLDRHIDRRDLTLVLSHVPGQKLQLDFASKTIPSIDRWTGEVR